MKETRATDANPKPLPFDKATIEAWEKRGFEAGWIQVLPGEWYRFEAGWIQVDRGKWYQWYRSDRPDASVVPAFFYPDSGPTLTNEGLKDLPRLKFPLRLRCGELA